MKSSLPSMISSAALIGLIFSFLLFAVDHVQALVWDCDEVNKIFHTNEVVNEVIHVSAMSGCEVRLTNVRAKGITFDGTITNSKILIDGWECVDTAPTSASSFVYDGCIRFTKAISGSATEVRISNVTWQQSITSSSHIMTAMIRFDGSITGGFELFEIRNVTMQVASMSQFNHVQNSMIWFKGHNQIRDINVFRIVDAIYNSSVAAASQGNYFSKVNAVQFEESVVSNIGLLEFDNVVLSANYFSQHYSTMCAVLLVSPAASKGVSYELDNISTLLVSNSKLILGQWRQMDGGVDMAVLRSSGVFYILRRGITNVTNATFVDNSVILKRFDVGETNVDVSCISLRACVNVQYLTVTGTPLPPAPSAADVSASLRRNGNFMKTSSTTMINDGDEAAFARQRGAGAFFLANITLPSTAGARYTSLIRYFIVTAMFAEPAATTTTPTKIQKVILERVSMSVLSWMPRSNQSLRVHMHNFGSTGPISNVADSIVIRHNSLQMMASRFSQGYVNASISAFFPTVVAEVRDIRKILWEDNAIETAVSGAPARNGLNNNAGGGSDGGGFHSFNAIAHFVVSYSQPGSKGDDTFIYQNISAAEFRSCQVRSVDPNLATLVGHVKMPNWEDKTLVIAGVHLSSSILMFYYHAEDGSQIESGNSNRQRQFSFSDCVISVRSNQMVQTPIMVAHPGTVPLLTMSMVFIQANVMVIGPRVLDSSIYLSNSSINIDVIYSKPSPDFSAALVRLNTTGKMRNIDLEKGCSVNIRTKAATPNINAANIGAMLVTMKKYHKTQVGSGFGSRLDFVKCAIRISSQCSVRVVSGRTRALTAFLVRLPASVGIPFQSTMTTPAVDMFSISVADSSIAAHVIGDGSGSGAAPQQNYPRQLIIVTAQTARIENLEVHRCTLDASEMKIAVAVEAPGAKVVEVADTHLASVNTRVASLFYVNNYHLLTRAGPGLRSFLLETMETTQVLLVRNFVNASRSSVVAGLVSLTYGPVKSSDLPVDTPTITCNADFTLRQNRLIATAERGESGVARVALALPLLISRFELKRTVLLDTEDYTLSPFTPNVVDSDQRFAFVGTKGSIGEIQLADGTCSKINGTILTASLLQSSIFATPKVSEVGKIYGVSEMPVLSLKEGSTTCGDKSGTTSLSALLEQNKSSNDNNQSDASSSPSSSPISESISSPPAGSASRTTHAGGGITITMSDTSSSDRQPSPSPTKSTSETIEIVPDLVNDPFAGAASMAAASTAIAAAFVGAPAESMMVSRALVGISLLDDCRDPRRKKDGKSAHLFEPMPFPISVFPGLRLGAAGTEGAYVTGALLSHFLVVLFLALVAYGIGYQRVSEVKQHYMKHVFPSSSSSSSSLALLGNKKSSGRARRRNNSKEDDDDDSEQTGKNNDDNNNNNIAAVDISSASPRQLRELRRDIEALGPLNGSPMLGFCLRYLGMSAPFWGMGVGISLAVSSSSSTHIIAAGAATLTFVLIISLIAALMIAWASADVERRPLCVRCTPFWSNSPSANWQRKLRSFLCSDLGRDMFVAKYSWQQPNRMRKNLDAPLLPPMGVLVNLGTFLGRVRGPRLRSSGDTVDRSMRYRLSPYFLLLSLVLTVICCIIKGASLEDPNLCKAARAVLFSLNVLTLVFTLAVRPFLLPVHMIVGLLLDLWSVIVSLLALPGVITDQDQKDTAKKVLGYMTTAIVVLPISHRVIQLALFKLSGPIQIVSVDAHRRHVTNLLDQLMSRPVVVGAAAHSSRSASPSSSSPPLSPSASSSRRMNFELLGHHRQQQNADDDDEELLEIQRSSSSSGEREHEQNFSKDDNNEAALLSHQYVQRKEKEEEGEEENILHPPVMSPKRAKRVFTSV